MEGRKLKYLSLMISLSSGYSQNTEFRGEREKKINKITYKPYEIPGALNCYLQILVLD